METFPEDKFQKARILGGDEGAGVGVMGGLRGLMAGGRRAREICW